MPPFFYACNPGYGKHCRCKAAIADQKRGAAPGNHWSEYAAPDDG